MKKDKRFSLRLRTYYLLIIAIVVIISFGAVVGALTALQQLGVIGHINVSTLVALLLVAAAASGSASFLVGRRVLAPMVKLSKASREVARGNYSITVEDPSKLEEVQTTLRNFNALVREMNRINNVTNDFVSSVSHEFKTPLTAIEGYAMLLQDTGLTQAERDEYLDKILYNTHRLSTLVGNILMLSKLENQSLSDQRSTFRLDEQLRQAVVMLEPQWEEKSLGFRAELDAVSVTACEPLLLQVWTNLIGNAIKFSEPGQELFLRLLDQTECVVVSVTDHGCGMTPEVQARIFEKFYQGDSSRKAMGNGLGLPLVKRIVELSDGVIEVDSAPGRARRSASSCRKSKTDAAGFYRCSVSACRKTLFDTLEDCEKVRKASNSYPSAYKGTVGCELRSKSKSM